MWMNHLVNCRQDGWKEVAQEMPFQSILSAFSVKGGDVELH